MIVGRKAAPLQGQPTVANCTGIKETPKIVVLVPERGIPTERWRSRQILRKDLASKHFEGELTDETKSSRA